MITKRRLINFISYNEYYGRQIFPICFKMSIIGLAVALILTIQEYFFYGFSTVFTRYCLTFALASFFIIIMTFSSVSRFVPDNKRILLILTSGIISEFIFIAGNIFIDLRFSDIIISVVFFQFCLLVIAPLVNLKILIIPNIILNFFIFFLLMMINADIAETARLILFSIISTIFVSFIMNYIRRYSVRLYNSAHENYLYSNLDMLSQLLNRRSWYKQSEEQFQKAEDSGKMIALIILDLDHFKKINDTYGHSCGDIVIQEVSRVLLENTRETDIIGRLGGEEFGILLKAKTISEAETIAERIRNSIETRCIPWENKTLKITASMGLAFSTKENLEDLVRKSDASLYEAKNNGRNKVVTDRRNS
jgi:diguanylate cyclase (GGDEF)-like protein